ncbi:MAG TPA: hypothetical protein VGQ59_09265, partial [Cyclobacteriaceae bacterium]|nr:hypothetical protein [Cyclobacteriaceae bacterium]
MAQAPTVTLTNQKNACDGLNNGRIDITVTSSANSPFTLFILGPQNFIAIPLATNVPFTASGLPSGGYSVIVQDSNAGTPDFNGGFAIAALSPDLSLALTASPPNPKDNTSCVAPNGTINIDVSGGSGSYSFLWSGPTSSPSAEDQAGLAGGNYNVVLSDNNSVCTRTFSTPITVADPSPISYIVTTSTPSICLGSSGTIKLANSETGVNYEVYLGGVSGTPTGITQGGTTGSPLFFTIPFPTYLTPAASYVFAIRAVNGFCTPVFMNGTPTIVVNPIPTITGTLTICGTGTTQLTGSGTAA